MPHRVNQLDVPGVKYRPSPPLHAGQARPVGAFFPIGRAATPTNRGRAAERIHIHQGSVVAKLARHESERTPFSRMLASVISAAG